MRPFELMVTYNTLRNGKATTVFSLTPQRPLRTTQQVRYFESALISLMLTTIHRWSSTGNATFTLLAAERADIDIANVFGQTLKATLSPPSSSHSKLSGEDIADIVVAIVIVLMSITAIVLHRFLVVIPRRKHHRGLLVEWARGMTD